MSFNYFFKPLLIYKLSCKYRVFVSVNLLFRFDRLREEVNICLVGKYTSLEDAYTSVSKSLRHAALGCRYKLNLQVCDITVFK